MGDRILVTGATGYIGGHVVEELLRRDLTVVATSRDEATARCHPWFDAVEYIPYDLNQPRSDPMAVFRHPDRVVHLAWDGLDDYRSPHHIEQVLPSHVDFLGALVAGGVRDLLVAGTCLEYGARCGPLCEDQAVDPCLAYGVAKDTLRRYLEVLSAAQSVRVRWMRLFYSYGPGQRDGSLFQSLARAVARGDRSFPMSAGEQVRDYSPVAELACSIVDVATQDHTLGVINGCSGTPVSVRALVERLLVTHGWSIQLELGRFPYPTWEPFAFWGDDRKLRRARGLDSV